MDETQYDLVISGARLRDRAQPCHIGISGTTIAAISDQPLRGRNQIDAEGNLVWTPFASAHLHLCKVNTLDMVGEDALRRYSAAGMGAAMSAIELASRVKDTYEEGWIAEHARGALRAGLRHGVTRVRAFADTDTRARLEAVKALLRVREEFAGLVDVQVVAFPQDGLIRDPGADRLVRQALELGADLVGGIPWIELTDDDARAHVRTVMDLAVEFDRDVAMLVDDAGDPSLRTTEMLAVAALERGFEGRVSACHARAMATYPEPYRHRLTALARRAGLSFVANPHTGPLHLPIFELTEAGLTVALGQDDIADAYYPFGQHNLLEVAFITAHVLHRYTLDDMELLLGMVTTQATRAMGLPAHELAPGSPADLVVLDGADIRQVLTRHAPPRSVVRGGRVLVENRHETRFAVEPRAPSATLGE